MLSPSWPSICNVLKNRTGGDACCVPTAALTMTTTDFIPRRRVSKHGLRRIGEGGETFVPSEVVPGLLGVVVTPAVQETPQTCGTCACAPVNHMLSASMAARSVDLIVDVVKHRKGEMEGAEPCYLAAHSLRDSYTFCFNTL